MNARTGCLRAVLEHAVGGALRRLGVPGNITWSLLDPQGGSRWDLSSNAAMKWAAASGRSATACAEELSNALLKDGAISDCAASPPGFVNMRIDDRVLLDAALLFVPVRRAEMPLFPPGHPLEDAPPFLRRLSALSALHACGGPSIDTGSPRTRALLLRLCGVGRGGEPDAREAFADLERRFEDCHREGTITPELCAAVSGAVTELIGAHDDSRRCKR